MQKELVDWWHKTEREEFSIDNDEQATNIDCGHGRIETRICEQVWVNSNWLSKDYQISSEVHEKITGKVTHEIR
ncbi:hypothetical protein [Shewanella sp. VB17]|uniref:hypothetical protein n=1 Tax=Shewanella sp. VB17 TaxID=2739432 RepID=UPI0035C88A8F